MLDSLVHPLFDGPLDIVGDVHGEIDALLSLMQHLGYTKNGNHPDRRRLVFVGDLTDRGPDSPAVVNLVQRLTKSGRAQCVLGNHDLNILLDHRKHDNGWFYGEEFKKDSEVVPQVLADETTRQRVLDFFRTLPIALERDDLRVVHACWNDLMIDIARESDDVVDLYNEHHDLVEGSFPDLDIDEIDRGLEHQNKNPVKLLSSGPEERTDKPIRASGKIRNERRVQWWNGYSGKYCVFGHYSIPNGKPRGGAVAFCVDYGIGKRWTERREGKTSGFTLKLAAFRWPERVVVFDEGKVERLKENQLEVMSVVETAIYVDDLKAAEHFYQSVLGLKVIYTERDRHVFFEVGESNVLLAFIPNTTLKGDALPPHGASGPGHFALGIETESFDAWRQHLATQNVKIEKELEWPAGGRSMYFRDPAGNSVELITPGVWRLPSGW